jgi:site-specific DNA-cytosine methylase
LQGFPDDWTAGCSDSTRYRQVGNAVAVPVAEWIIQNICDTI